MRASKPFSRIGFAAAAAWVALGLESTVVGGEHHYRDGLVCIPWVLTMVTFAGLYVAQRDRLARWGRVAFGVMELTMVLIILGQAGVIFDLPLLRGLGFPLGALLWLAALVPAGIATYRAGVVPRHVGVLVTLLEALSIGNGVVLAPIAGLYDRGNYSGGIAKGLVVLSVALALSRLTDAGRRPPAGPPADRHTGAVPALESR